MKVYQVFFIYIKIHCIKMSSYQTYKYNQELNRSIAICNKIGKPPEFCEFVFSSLLKVYYN